MAERELPSGSDDSDDDYVPDGETGNVSEELDSGDAESDVEDSKGSPAKKKRRKGETVKDEEPPAETSNIDVDALWADFKKDTDQPKKQETAKEPKDEVRSADIEKPLLPTAPTKFQRKPPIFTPVANTSKGGGGISSILGQLGKKNKVSILEKSKLDWNNFKQAEGIEEDLKTHNKGKDGFLEKRDFLERTDLRQFEIEKQLRAMKRSNR